MSVLLAASFLALSTACLAGPALPGSALESPVGRFLLSETAQGLALMTKILGRKASSTDLTEFLVRLRGEHPMSAEMLETRLRVLRENLYQAQNVRTGSGEARESDSFSGEERTILRMVADRELSLDPRWNPHDPSTGEIRFTEAGSAGLQANREAFLGPESQSEIRVESAPGELAPPEIQQRAKFEFKDWYNESQACLASRPTEANKSANLRYLAEQWVISGSVTTIGYFAQAGISHFEIGELGLDLSMTLLNQWASVAWMSKSTTFEARWLKVFAMSSLRNELDAEIYQISPWTNTHGLPMKQATSERKAYGYAWNAKTSWISPLMYTILNGTECLLDQRTGPGAAKLASRFRVGAFAFRTAVSVGTSLMFYKMRTDNPKKAR